VSTDGEEQLQLESAVARVYGGPPEGFVGRRTELAKELRAAGRREDAAMVKGLRKPSRMAWALDAATLDGTDAIARLAAAVDGVRLAQSGGRDLRAAIAELRAAVRRLADAAAAGAAERGHPVDDAALVNAVLAVVADPQAFAALRAGRLVDIPEADGLDFLSGGATAASDPPGAPRVEASAAAGRAAAATAAREELQRAESDLTAARERAAAAARALREAEAAVERAEAQVRAAERELSARRTDRQRAAEKATAAASRADEAEQATAAARARLGAAGED
jgi:hypothetical protein